MRADVLSEYKFSMVSHHFRRDRFVGWWIGKHAVGVDARFVREGVLSNHGFRRRYWQSRVTLHKFGDAVKLVQLDSSFDFVEVSEREHNLFKRGISSTLTQAVNCHMDFLGSSFDRGERVRSPHAEIIVAVGSNGHFHDLREFGEKLIRPFRGEHAHGIAYANSLYPLLDCCREELL
ncbi:hypothetical protein ES703_44305 [subsurface metagenome]